MVFLSALLSLGLVARADPEASGCSAAWEVGEGPLLCLNRAGPDLGAGSTPSLASERVAAGAASRVLYPLD